MAHHGGNTQIVPIGPSRTSASATKPRGNREVFAVQLGPRAFVAAWLGISVLHMICGAYLIVTGLVYWTLPGHKDMFYIDFYAVALQSSHYRSIASVHFGVAAVHIVLLVRPLVVRFWRQVDERFRATSRVLRRSRSSRRPSLRGFLCRILDKVVACYWWLFARTGLFGVEGRYYEVFFAVNEVLDIVLQTNQAFQMSRQLPHRWLNRFYVVTLVLNCVLTPFVHTIVPDRSLQRLLCRLGDIALDFLVSVAVPAELARRFYGYYDPALGTVPVDLWYDDKWFIQTLKEAPIVLFGSWFDALSRLAFSIGVIMSLNSVKNLLRRSTAPTSHHAASQLSAPAPQVQDVVSTRSLRFLHGTMVVIGIAVIGVHTHAEARASPAACVLEVRPWLTPRPACALIEFNCFYHRDRNGNKTEFQFVFGALYAPSLAQIVFRHCPHVEITPLLQDLHELVGFKTYNSTIVAWNETAALTQTNHPHARFAFFVRTNFSGGVLPPGLLSPDDFPYELRDVEISVSNLDQLPSDLHERWPEDMSLVVEFSRLTEVPPTLLQMCAHSIGLDANQIYELPVGILVDPCSVYTSFSGNPITALPDTTEAITVPTLVRRRLVFAFTALATLPAWMATTEFLARTRVIATETPLCQYVQDGSLPDNVSPAWTNAIDCSASSVGYYPLHSDERVSEMSW